MGKRLRTAKTLGSIFQKELRYYRLALTWDKNPSKVGTILRHLHDTGISVVEGYWSGSEVSKALELLYRIDERMPQADQSNYVTQKEGAIRISSLEKYVAPLRKKYYDDPLITAVARHFYGIGVEPKNMMYAKTWFSENLELLDNDMDTVGFGRIGFHFDVYWHQLKTMVFLSDVGEENGPLLYCPGTNGFSLAMMAKICRAVMVGRGYHGINLYFTQQEEARLGLNELAIPVTGSKGTLVFLDTRGAHKAAFLRKGERHVLWNYFV